MPDSSSLIVALALLCVPGPQEPVEPLLEGLGSHTRKVSTDSPDAQRFFDQGLNLLFAFNHDEAARSFRQATQIDPACAMAWWGLALAQGPHINRPLVDAEQARIAHEALARAQASDTHASDIERAMIAALSSRCLASPPEDRSALDRAYADAMLALRSAHPADADLGALTAEALMNLRPWDLYTADGSPQPGTEAIVALLESVLQADPAHPLANHLYIHAVEASDRPGRAEAAADRLRDLQPGLSHNVHMPSHIDVRLGRWEAAEESNRKAIAADRQFLAVRPNPGFYGLYIAHNYHMLAFAAMMRGKSQTAIDAIDEMAGLMPPNWAMENAAIADGYIAMPLEVRLRFGRWDEVLAVPEPATSFPLARALRHHARGVALAARDEVDAARSEQVLFRAARALVPETSVFGNNKAADLLAVADRYLDGEILYRSGREADAFTALREAATLEDRLRYSEPPDWILPARHALGAALLRSGRPIEAEAVYREDLDRLPNNGWSLFGLARSLTLQGKHDEANSVNARWESIWREADFTLTSSCLCLPGK